MDDCLVTQEQIDLAYEIRELADNNADEDLIALKLNKLERLLNESRFGFTEILSVDEAKSILGEENVLGPEAVKQAFGLDLEKRDIPKIPFSRLELLRAQGLEQILILRVNSFGDSTPITIESIRDKIEPRLIGKIFSSNTSKHLYRYNNEKFLTNDNPIEDNSLKAQWALIYQNPLQRSYSGYPEQVKLLKDHIKNNL